LYKATPNRGALLGFGAECKEAHLTIRHAFLNFLNKKLCGDRFSIFPILVSDSFGLALWSRAPAGWVSTLHPSEYCSLENNTSVTTIEKITEKLDEIASRASNRRRDVGQLVDALRVAVSTIAKLGAPPTEMTPEEAPKSMRRRYRTDCAKAWA
jgi:hypothetical protein